MNNIEFSNKFDFDKLKDNFPEIQTGNNTDTGSTDFLEYDKFMDWFRDYSLEMGDVYGCNVKLEDMPVSTLGSVNSVSKTDILKQEYHSDIRVNKNYLDPDSDDSHIREFTMQDGSKTKGISTFDAFQIVKTVAHEGRHIEQNQHIAKGTYDESLDLTMSSGFMISGNASHYNKHYNSEPAEIDAQNTGLSRGLDVFKACCPEYDDKWFDAMKENVWYDKRYSKYATGDIEKASVSDVNDIFKNSFMDSCISYDTSYSDFITNNDPSLMGDDIYKNNTEISLGFPPKIQSGDVNIMKGLEDNPSYIKFHNDYMIDTIDNMSVFENIASDSERFQRATDKIDSISDTLNSTASEEKKLYENSGGSRRDYYDLMQDSKELLDDMIPEYSISKYDDNEFEYTHDTKSNPWGRASLEEEDTATGSLEFAGSSYEEKSKSLSEITGIDFDEYERDLRKNQEESKALEEMLGGRILNKYN